MGRRQEWRRAGTSVHRPGFRSAQCAAFQHPAAALRARCSERVARYKVPEDFVFVDDFPRTPMGKIRKVDLA